MLNTSTASAMTFPRLLILTSSLLAAAASAFGARSVAHLDRGETLVEQMLLAHASGKFFEGDVFLNTYGGSWDSPTDSSFFRLAHSKKKILPRNRTTCAPFVTHLLRSTYGWDWKNHRILHPRTGGIKATASPNPVLYYSAIKNRVGFTHRLTKMKDVRPGDIASIWYKKETGDKGHTMIVVAVNPKPKPYTAVVDAQTKSAHRKIVPKLTGKLVYEVTVLDSSSTGHTRPAPAGTAHAAKFNAAQIDTRWLARPDSPRSKKLRSAALTGGAGVGVIGIIVDPATGKIVGHTWSLPYVDYKKARAAWHRSVNDRVYFQATRELVIGRLPANLPVRPAQPGFDYRK